MNLAVLQAKVRAWNSCSRRSSSAVECYPRHRLDPPPGRCVVVVRSRVGDEITRIVVRTEPWSLRIVAESELQHRHAGIGELIADGFDLRSDDAEILGDDGSSPNSDCTPEKSSAPGPLTHCPFWRCVATGNFPVRFKSAEMVDADDVIEAHCGTETINPPSVTVF